MSLEQQKFDIKVGAGAQVGKIEDMVIEKEELVRRLDNGNISLGDLNRLSDLMTLVGMREGVTPEEAKDIEVRIVQKRSELTPDEVN